MVRGETASEPHHRHCAQPHRNKTCLTGFHLGRLIHVMERHMELLLIILVVVLLFGGGGYWGRGRGYW